jgi:hypothetical protein
VRIVGEGRSPRDVLPGVTLPTDARAVLSARWECHVRTVAPDVTMVPITPTADVVQLPGPATDHLE